MKLFVFGTLRDKDTLERVIHHPSYTPHKRAVLPGYFKFHCYGLDYVIPCRGRHVRGILWENLSEMDTMFLDYFEGVKQGYYKRQTVHVAVDGTIVEAEAYVCGDKWYE